MEGEAGIGKSRLIQIFLQTLNNNGLQFLYGEASSVEARTPYFAWRRVFQQIFPNGRPNLSANLEPLRPLLTAVFPSEQADTSLTAQMQGQGRANKTLDLLTQQKNNILVLEDAHWLDSSSWALLKRIWLMERPFLILLVTRPISQNPPPEYTFLHQMAQTISLSALPEPAIEQILYQRLQVSELPPQMATSRALANPHKMLMPNHPTKFAIRCAPPHGDGWGYWLI